MKHKSLIIIILTITLMGLSSCAKKQVPAINPVTNDQVKETLTSLLHVDGTIIKMRDLVVLSIKTESNQADAIATVVIENGRGVFHIKVTLRYLQGVKNYVYLNSQIETLSSTSSTKPDPNEALRVFQQNPNTDTYYGKVNSEVVMFNTEPMSCHFFQYDADKGTALIDCEEKFQFLDQYATGMIRIKAIYSYDKDWVYTSDSWIYTETAQLKGPYLFTVGSALIGKETPFKPNEVITLNFQGKLVSTYKSDDSVTTQNTLSGTMDKDSKTLDFTVTPMSKNDAFKLKIQFGSNANDYLILSEDSGTGRCGPSDPPSYYVTDAAGNYFSLKNTQTSSGVTIQSVTDCAVTEKTPYLSRPNPIPTQTDKSMVGYYDLTATRA